MTDGVISSSLVANIRRIVKGDQRFVPDREGMLDSGPGYACFEVSVDNYGIARLSASADPLGPTVIDFNVRGGPWGTEIEMVGDVLSATVDGKFLGRVPADVMIDGSRLVDILSALRAAAVAAGRRPFVFGPPAAVLDAAA